jgi:hypothetical protein
MMRQDGTTARRPATRYVPEWRLNKRTYELPYLMKLGNISRREGFGEIVPLQLSRVSSRQAGRPKCADY